MQLTSVVEKQMCVVFLYNYQVLKFSKAKQHLQLLTSFRSLEDSLVNHWLYSRAAMIGIRSLEAEITKYMKVLLQ